MMPWRASDFFISGIFPETLCTMNSASATTIRSCESSVFEMKLAKRPGSMQLRRVSASRKIMIFRSAVKKRYLKKKSSLASNIVAHSCTIFPSSCLTSSQLSSMNFIFFSELWCFRISMPASPKSFWKNSFW